VRITEIPRWVKAVALAIYLVAFPLAIYPWWAHPTLRVLLGNMDSKVDKMSGLLALSPDIELDLQNDVIVLYGVRYSLEVFRALGLAKLGTVLRIVGRDNGVVAVEQLPDPLAPAPPDTAEQAEAYRQRVEAAEQHIKHQLGPATYEMLMLEYEKRLKAKQEQMEAERARLAAQGQRAEFAKQVVEHARRTAAYAAMVLEHQKAAG
jgi:hypothetical protein